MLELLSPLALLLLQQQDAGTQIEPSATGVIRLFAGLVLVLIIFAAALLFTWWISREE